MTIRKDEMFLHVIVFSRPTFFYTEGYARVSALGKKWIRFAEHFSDTAIFK